MKNRLELARELLRDDGAIFVQIDNSPSDEKNSPEFGYLFVLMDEIFGRKNYMTTLCWKKKGGASNTQEGLGTITESVLFYAKNCDSIDINLMEYKRKYKFEDENGPYNLEPPVKTNEGEYERKKMQFKIITKEGIFLPPKNKRWTYGEKSINEIIKAGKYQIVDNKFYIKKYASDYKKGNAKLFNNLLLEHGSLNSAKSELEKLGFKREKFSSPKPESLIQRIIDMCTNPNDIVLDFFLGSGTTCAVAHKMNRQYIGIEQMNYIETIAVTRLKKVIAGEQGGISKNVGWIGGGSFVYCELKENAQSLITEIQNAESENISAIKEKIYTDARIVPYITSNELKEVDNDFESLNLADKKKVLIKLIDKNKLYVNYSDIEDENFKISNEDKKFTKSFYEDEGIVQNE